MRGLFFYGSEVVGPVARVGAALTVETGCLGRRVKSVLRLGALDSETNANLDGLAFLK
jgi:hypothetical protein